MHPQLFFLRSYSRYPFQACLSCCFFLRQKKSFRWSLLFAKKKCNNPAQGFPLLSGLGSSGQFSVFSRSFQQSCHSDAAGHERQLTSEAISSKISNSISKITQSKNRQPTTDNRQQKKTAIIFY